MTKYFFISILIILASQQALFTSEPNSSDHPFIPSPSRKTSGLDQLEENKEAQKHFAQKLQNQRTKFKAQNTITRFLANYIETWRQRRLLDQQKK